MAELFGDVQLEITGRGRKNVAVLSLDSRRNKLNVLDEELLRSLNDSVGRVEALVKDGKIDVVVLCSRKDVFAAGADIAAQLRIDSPGVGENLAGVFKDGIRRLENLPVATIAIINGTCLGGGLEIALACDYRVAGVAATNIGLPEIKVGVLPAGGGCVRLPRLIGLAQAVGMIVPGRAIAAKECLALGLVDSLFQHTSYPSGDDASPSWMPELLDHWKANKLSTPLTPTTKFPRQFLGNTWSEQKIINTFALRQIDSTKMNIPSPYAALHTIMKTWNLPYNDAFAVESAVYGQLIVREETKALLSLFLNGTKAKSESLTYGLDNATSEQPLSSSSSSSPTSSSSSAVKIKYAVVILGAGHMGGGIAQGLLHKCIPVILYDISSDMLTIAKERIYRLFQPLVKKRKLTQGQVQERMDLLTLVTTITLHKPQPDVCQVCIECIPEHLALKKEIVAKVEAEAERTGVTIIFASNTSSIPISLIADAAQHPSNVVGMHFFHPEKNITPIVEIPVATTTAPSTARAIASLANDLGKLPIVVKEGPGFVVNRVMGVLYALSATVLCLGGASFGRIESTMLQFGFKAGPFEILDGIGLKTALLVGKSMQALSADRVDGGKHALAVSKYITRLLEKMLEKKFHGRSPVGNSKGFYEWTNGKKTTPNPDVKAIAMIVRSEIAQEAAIAKSSKSLATSRMAMLSPGELTDLLIFGLVNEACAIVDEELCSPSSVDLLLVLTGFPTKYGGPLLHSDRVGHKNCVDRLTSSSTAAFGNMPTFTRIEIAKSLITPNLFFPDIPHIRDQPPFPPRSIPFFFDAVAIFLSVLVGLGAQQLIASHL